MSPVPVALAALALPDHAAGARGTVADALAAAEQARRDRSAAARAEQDRHAAEVAEAYARGHADASAAARTTALDALAALAADVRALRENAAVLVAEQVAADATTVLDAASALATWVLGRELAEDPAALLPVVTETLRSVVDPRRAVVHVHPDTAAAVTGWAADLGVDAPAVAVDAALPVGHARLETADGGVADISVAEALRRALLAAADLTGPVSTVSPA